MRPVLRSSRQRTSNTTGLPLHRGIILYMVECTREEESQRQSEKLEEPHHLYTYTSVSDLKRISRITLRYV